MAGTEINVEQLEPASLKMAPCEVLAKGANHAATVGLGHPTTVRSNALRVGDECKEPARSLPVSRSPAAERPL